MHVRCLLFLVRFGAKFLVAPIVTNCTAVSSCLWREVSETYPCIYACVCVCVCVCVCDVYDSLLQTAYHPLTSPCVSLSDRCTFLPFRRMRHGFITTPTRRLMAAECTTSVGPSSSFLCFGERRKSCRDFSARCWIGCIVTCVQLSRYL